MIHVFLGDKSLFYLMIFWKNVFNTIIFAVTSKTQLETLKKQEPRGA